MMYEIKEKAQINKVMKDETNLRVQQTKQYHQQKTKMEASETKTDKYFIREQWEFNKRNEEQRAQQIKQMIKMQQSEA